MKGKMSSLICIVCDGCSRCDRWKEALDLASVKYRRPLLGLIEHLPDCVPILFDRCISQSHPDRKHKDFHVSQKSTVGNESMRSSLVSVHL